VEQGREAARQAGLIMLTKIRVALGTLDRVKGVDKVLGMVNSAEGFGDQPLVVNGFSDLMGEEGKAHLDPLSLIARSQEQRTCDPISGQASYRFQSRLTRLSQHRSDLKIQLRPWTTDRAANAVF
jgi:hypothetical protein